MKESILLLVFGILIACSEKHSTNEFDPNQVLPKEIIDLSPVIGEDIAEKKWGSAALQMMGFRGKTNFLHVGIDTPAYVRNSYIEIFNHGGAHLDAPNHMEKDAMSIEHWDLMKLIGPVKIFDATSYPNNTSISVEELKQMNLSENDIFMLHVNYIPPQNDNELPAYPFLSSEACEYLASIPVKAVATDALSIESFNGFSDGIEAGLTGYKDLIPNHYAILTNEIPLFESLEDLSPLLEKENVIFVGFPLKIKNGNGSPVRAAAFVY
jgi:kynurenine formamidase